MSGWPAALSAPVTAPTSVQPLQADKMVWWLEVGGSQGLGIRGFDPAGRADEIPVDTFVDFGGLKTPPVSGKRHEAAFQSPVLGKPPTAGTGDYWLGSLYFDATTKKLRVNTGGAQWQDLH